MDVSARFENEDGVVDITHCKAGVYLVAQRTEKEETEDAKLLRDVFGGVSVLLSPEKAREVAVALIQNAAASEAWAQTSTVDVFVNGRAQCFDNSTVSYEDVLESEGHNPGRIFTVTYSKGPATKPDGVLAPGQSVHVVNGMRFSCYDTSNA